MDTNVLVYAHREDLPRHEAARERLLELAEGRIPWAIPAICLADFLRVTTHPRVFREPSSPEEAIEALDRVLASPTVRVLVPGSHHWNLLQEAIVESGSRGNLVFDAQIVATCREAGVAALLTEDRDFARFRGFRTLRLRD